MKEALFFLLLAQIHEEASKKLISFTKVANKLYRFIPGKIGFFMQL